MTTTNTINAANDNANALHATADRYEALAAAANGVDHAAFIRFTGLAWDARYRANLR